MKILKQNMSRIKYIVITVVLIIGFCLFIFLEIPNTSGQNQIIDLSGNNAYWKASLNINLGYKNELIIQPRREDFLIPSEITVSIIKDEEIIYSNNLQYIPNEINPKLLGSYMTYFNSSNLKGNEKKLILNISYSDNDISILLK